MDDTFLYLIQNDPKFSIFCSDMSDYWIEHEEIGTLSKHKIRNLSIDFRSTTGYVEENKRAVKDHEDEDYLPWLYDWQFCYGQDKSFTDKLIISEFEK